MAIVDSASDIFSAVGSVAYDISGDFNIVDDNEDVFAAEGTVAVSGDIAINDDTDDIFSAGGHALTAILGDIAITDDTDDTFSAIGVVASLTPITGDMAITDDSDDLFLATGAVSAEAIVGFQTLSWPTVAGADGYAVDRRTGGNAFERFDVSAHTSVDLRVLGIFDESQVYTFRVFSYTVDGGGKYTLTQIGSDVTWPDGGIPESSPLSVDPSYIDCAALQCQTITPSRNTGPIITAGQNVEQAAKWHYSTLALQKSATMETYASVRYFRYTWSLLNPSLGVYRWDLVQRDIDAAKVTGKQVAFRIITYNPQVNPTVYPDAVPGWFKTAAEARGVVCTGQGSSPNYAGSPNGCSYFKTRFTGACQSGSTCTDLWAPNMNEVKHASGLDFQSQMLAMWESFKANILTKQNLPWIAYIDVCPFGNWAENHTDTTKILGTSVDWPMPNQTYFKSFIDTVFAEAPDSLPLLINFQAGWPPTPSNRDAWIYFCQKAAESRQIASTRNDGLDTTAYLVDPKLAANAVLANAWKYGPVNGEPNSANFSSVSAGVTALTKFGGTWKGAAWNNKYVNVASDPNYAQDILNFWNSTYGYRLYPAPIKFPVSATASDTFQAEVTITNNGTTPFFSSYHSLWMRFAPAVGASTNVELGGDLFKIMPGASRLFVGRDIQLAAGTYTVSVGAQAKSSYGESVPIVRLELSGSGPWYSVGTLVVSA